MHLRFLVLWVEVSKSLSFFFISSSSLLSDTPSSPSAMRASIIAPGIQHQASTQFSLDQQGSFTIIDLAEIIHLVNNLRELSSGPQVQQNERSP